MAKGEVDTDLPAELIGKSEVTVLYRNLEAILAESVTEGPLQESSVEYGNKRLFLALQIDHAIREKAPANWKGDEVKEKLVLNALFPIMNRDRAATLAIFEIIKNQPGY